MKNKMVLGAIFGIVIGLVIGVPSGYFAFKSRAKNNEAELVKRFPHLKNLMANQDRPQSPPAEKTTNAERVAFINSIPQGAKIFVNGEDTNKKTPNVIPIESDKKINLTLKAEGYFELVLNEMTEAQLASRRMLMMKPNPSAKQKTH